MHRLVAIVGPTASGKSALALKLAREYDGEIINADSRQFYRGMDIGTAKPNAEQLAAVPHHLVDFLDPTDSFSLAEFLNRARSLIDEINSRRRLPILVGGTGQYVWALLEGWRVPEIPPDPGIRSRLEVELQERGVEALAARLSELNPETAGRTDLRNPRRVIRALERALSDPAGEVRPEKSATPPYDALVIGLHMDREVLHRRIRERIDAMINLGWRDEVNGLLDSGVPADATAMSAIGYREMAMHVEGKLPLEGVRSKATAATNRLVRHQNNWFKADDPRITWIEATAADPFPAAEKAIEAWLRRTSEST